MWYHYGGFSSPLSSSPLLSSPLLTWDSEISSSHSACPYSQQGGTCHFTCVHVCLSLRNTQWWEQRRNLCVCVCVVAEGGQGSDLSDREIATWFKWLACSRQSLDRRVNWLLAYLQSNATALTHPTQPRPHLSLFLSALYLPCLSLFLFLSILSSITHTRPRILVYSPLWWKVPQIRLVMIMQPFETGAECKVECWGFSHVNKYRLPASSSSITNTEMNIAM